MGIYIKYMYIRNVWENAALTLFKVKGELV